MKHRLSVAVGTLSGALISAALFSSGGAGAASTSVIVKDPDSTAKAQVDGGALRIGDGQGPLTVNGNVRVPTSASANLTVEETPTEPFQVDRLFLFAPGEFEASDTFTVPPGKRLVIDYASGAAGLPQGQIIRAFIIETQVGDNTVVGPVEHRFVPTLQPGTNIYAFSTPTKLYADPQTTVRLKATRFDATGEQAARMQVSGHLTDL